MYQLIIFDWDGTIMDSAQKIANCISAAALDVGLEQPTEQEAKNIIGLSLFEAMTVLFPHESKELQAEMVERYKHHWLFEDETDQQLFAGVEEGLQTLHEIGAFLAIATGKSRRGLNSAFIHANVESYFVTTRCADETRSKPHPQMINEILDFTSIEPDKTIMVGDTTYDLDMAQSAGVDALGVSYGVHCEQALKKSGAIEICDSFNEVVSWLTNGRTEPAFK